MYRGLGIFNVENEHLGKYVRPNFSKIPIFWNIMIVRYKNNSAFSIYPVLVYN